MAAVERIVDFSTPGQPELAVAWASIHPDGGFVGTMFNENSAPYLAIAIESSGGFVGAVLSPEDVGELAEELEAYLSGLRGAFLPILGPVLALVLHAPVA